MKADAGESEKIPAAKSARLGEIARAFLRLGFVAFGGAAAHVGLMEEEFVRRRRWLTREEFLAKLVPAGGMSHAKGSAGLIGLFVKPN